MYNRRLILLIIALGSALGLLIWNWNVNPGMNLNAGTGIISSGRWDIDLTGQWKTYPSLRQAWITESEEEKSLGQRLTGGNPVTLPSSQSFHVATKTFKIPAEWNARTLILQLNGVRGKGTVYLNGIESTHRIGNFVSEGGSESLEIPIKALRYGEDNLFLFELEAPPSQEQTVAGFRYPVMGQITGQVSLQAVMETTLENPQLHVQWEKDRAKVQVELRLNHHGFLEYGPWNVQGVLSDGSADVAQAEVLVQSQENSVQTVQLNFDVPGGRKWTSDDPFLYQLYLTVTNPKGDKDDLAFPVGLSSLQYNQGVFQQQGKELSIKGIALSPEAEFRIREKGEIIQQLKGFKKKGYNLLYFIGGFPDELWLKNADRLGMGIWAELPGSAMVPAKRLPNPQIFTNLVWSGSLHPSLWAYTTGKGLEINNFPSVSTYEKAIEKLTQPTPHFNVSLINRAGNALGTATYEKGRIKGTWGEIEFPEESMSSQRTIWLQEKWASGLCLLVVIFVSWANLVAQNWRYKELQTRKPKRSLRRAWFWNGLAFLSREMTLAGAVTSFLLVLEPPWNPLIPNQWPLWEGLKQQPPELIWVILGLLFTLMRLLQVGVVAPNLPDSPSPMGVTLWLEHRYLWFWVVALLWAAQPWGVPKYIPLLVYLGLSLLFLPLKIRDVRRIGGRYASFFLVPGVIVMTFGLFCLSRYEDVLYLFHLAKAFI